MHNFKNLLNPKHFYLILISRLIVLLRIRCAKKRFKEMKKLSQNFMSTLVILDHCAMHVQKFKKSAFENLFTSCRFCVLMIQQIHKNRKK